jgi:hypothetical protein
MGKSIEAGKGSIVQKMHIPNSDKLTHFPNNLLEK